MTTKRRLLIVTPLACAVVVLAACGGGTTADQGFGPGSTDPTKPLGTTSPAPTSFTSEECSGLGIARAALEFPRNEEETAAAVALFEKAGAPQDVRDATMRLVETEGSSRTDKEIVRLWVVEVCHTNPTIAGEARPTPICEGEPPKQLPCAVR